MAAKTVGRWAKENRISFVKTPGGHRRYPYEEVQNLLRANYTEALYLKRVQEMDAMIASREAQ